jgi:hypothetical protein
LNAARDAFSTVPGGLAAATQSLGQWSYASGVFAQPGDAQASLYVLRGTSDGAYDTTELFLDGAGERIQFDGVRAMTFDILVVGRSAQDPLEWYWTGAHIVGTAAVDPAGAIQVNDYTKSFGNPLSLAALAADSGVLRLVVEQADFFEGPVQWVAVVRTADVAW